MYLTILEETQQKYPFHLHSYCLMTNHVHLLLETLKIPPPIFMKSLNSRYAMYFNRKYKLTGHLFQGRYHDEVISSPIHLLEVSRYIHLNPVKAYIVKHPEEYPWSSYRSYVSNNSKSHIKTDAILRFFQNQPFQGRPKENYKRFVYQEYWRWLQANN
jgi:REP element-mobilizing transposase RayT